MSSPHSHRAAFRFASAAVSLCALQLLAGCALNSTVAPTSEPASVSAVQGRVHGGQQPVFNSTVAVYAVGATGYGAGATKLASTSTAANGTFTLPAYTCPSGNPQVYLTATGGDPSGNASTSTNNSAIVLAAALGSCVGLQTTFVQVNEVTTAAAAFALGQFFGGFGTTSDLVGAPASNATGLVNAFATAHNLASTSTGTATGTTAATGTNYFLNSNDQLKLNTIANILAACVNTTSASAANCTTLFAAVTPSYAPLTTSTPATAPIDIFQAAVYMSLNPTSTNSTASAANLATLYGLAAATAPFQPYLTTGPSDWTLAIQYSGTGINYLSSAAVDANGDLWFSNSNTTGGVVMLNGGTGKIGGTAGVTGGDIGFYSSGTYTPNGGTLTTATANGTRQVAIDQNGYAWFPGYTAYDIFKATGGVGVTGVFPLPSGPTLPYAIAIDPADNVFATTGSTQIVSVANSAASGTVATQTASLEASSGAASLSITPASVGYAPTNGGSSLYEFGTAALTATSGSPFSPAGVASAYGSAVDATGRVLIVNKNATSIIPVTGSTAGTAISSSCLSTPEYLAVDGNNNIWVANNGNTTAMVNGVSSTIDTVCEFNSAGTLISSSTGYGPHGITSGRGIAVDLSGNVWVTSYTTGTSTVAEIVGAAVPVVSPISVALKNNTVGTRP